MLIVQALAQSWFEPMPGSQSFFSAIYASRLYRCCTNARRRVAGLTCARQRIEGPYLGVLASGDLAKPWIRIENRFDMQNQARVG